MQKLREITREETRFVYRYDSQQEFAYVRVFIQDVPGDVLICRHPEATLSTPFTVVDSERSMDKGSALDPRSPKCNLSKAKELAEVMLIAKHNAMPMDCNQVRDLLWYAFVETC